MSQPPSLPQGSPPSPLLLNIENQQADGHAEDTSENMPRYTSIRIFENGAWLHNEALQSLNERQIDELSEEEQAAATQSAAEACSLYEECLLNTRVFSIDSKKDQGEVAEATEGVVKGETGAEAETGAGAGVEAEVKVDVGIEAGAGAEAEAEIELKAETAEELVVRPKEKTDKNKRKKEKKKEKKKELEKKEKMKPSADDDELLAQCIEENQSLLQKPAATLGAEAAILGAEAAASSTPMSVSSGQAVPEGSTLSPIIYFFNDPTYRKEYLFLEAKFVGGLNSIIIALRQKKSTQLRLGVKVIKESRFEILQAFKYIEKKMATALFFEQNTALDDELGLRFLGYARQIQNHYQQKIAPKLPLFLNINTGNEIDIIDVDLFGNEVNKYNEANFALLNFIKNEINRYNKNKQ